MERHFIFHSAHANFFQIIFPKIVSLVVDLDILGLRVLLISQMLIITFGTLKARVYHQFKPENMQALKEKIKTEIQLMRIDEISRAVANLHHRCELILQQNGSHIQHLP